MTDSTTIYTIGHSTRSIEEFIAILKSFEIESLVDVRSLPGSRHCPQFNGEELAVSLAAAGIDYQHMHGLGGRRHTRKDSANVGWRNASFRGYADYMQTPEFEANLAELIRLGRERRVVIMLRRGGAVALPSLADRRRAVGPRPERAKTSSPRAKASRTR